MASNFEGTIFTFFFYFCSFVAKNPCSSDPGCDHVCYTSDDQPLCACFANYELQSNGKTCKGTGLVSLFRNRLIITLLWDNLISRFANLFQTQFEMVGKILLAINKPRYSITKSRFSICVYKSQNILCNQNRPKELNSKKIHVTRESGGQ